jgi:hypothetical protein
MRGLLPAIALASCFAVTAIALLRQDSLTTAMTLIGGGGGTNPTDQPFSSPDGASWVRRTPVR